LAARETFRARRLSAQRISQRTSTSPSHGHPCTRGLSVRPAHSSCSQFCGELTVWIR
jgi:hypothetical protein